jgi:hypothetical protein
VASTPTSSNCAARRLADIPASVRVTQLRAAASRDGLELPDGAGVRDAPGEGAPEEAEGGVDGVVDGATDVDDELVSSPAACGP